MMDKIYVVVKWPWWRLKLPVNRVFVQQFDNKDIYALLSLYEEKPPGTGKNI